MLHNLVDLRGTEAAMAVDQGGYHRKTRSVVITYAGIVTVKQYALQMP
jgi:hypothetical protein